MSTRSTDELYSSQIKQQMQALGSQQIKSLGVLSTGQKINTPSDDPQATGRVLRFQSDKKELLQYQKNADHAIAVSDISGDAISSMNKNLVRAEEILLDTNTELGAAAFSGSANEVNQLIEAMLNLGNAEYLGSPIFAGTKTNTPPFNPTRDVNGKVTSVAYDGNTAGNTFYISDNTEVSPYADGALNNDILGSITNLISLRDALEAANPTAVAALMPTIVASQESVVEAMANFGSLTARFQSAKDLNDVAISGSDQRINKEISADFTATLVDLNRLQTALEGTMQASARALKVSLLNFI